MFLTLTIMLTHKHNHMLVMLTHIMHFYMSRFTHAPIVAEKVTWLSFVMIELMLLMIIFGLGRLAL